MYRIYEPKSDRKAGVCISKRRAREICAELEEQTGLEHAFEDIPRRVIKRKPLKGIEGN